jgi:hypothetical protein
LNIKLLNIQQEDPHKQLLSCFQEKVVTNYGGGKVFTASSSYFIHGVQEMNYKITSAVGKIKQYTHIKNFVPPLNDKILKNYYR